MQVIEVPVVGLTYSCVLMTAGESCGPLEVYEALLTIYNFISLLI